MSGAKWQVKVNSKNIIKYLSSRQRQLLFLLNKIIRVHEVSEYSNNNYIFRLEVGKGKSLRHYYLKQAQAFNRRSLQKGKPIAVAVHQKQPKGYSLSKLVEGLYRKGAPALLVDDVVATAASKEIFLDNASNELTIKHVAVILDDSSGEAEIVLASAVSPFTHL